MRTKMPADRYCYYATFCALYALCSFALNANAGFSEEVTAPSYLGNWLVTHRIGTPLVTPDVSNDDFDWYGAGLMWQSQAELAPQAQQRQQLLDILMSLPAKTSAEMNARERLTRFVSTHPATGRVVVQSTDARWLQTNVSSDPYLRTGDKIIVPNRPETVTVIRTDGTLCAVSHHAGIEALQYVLACDKDAAPDVAWIVQPNGTVSAAKVALWNREPQDFPAPGSWIFAPNRNSLWTHDVAQAFAHFVATQGVSGFDDAGHASGAYNDAPLAQTHADAFPITEDDWGEAGILQTPTARMRGASDASVSVSHVAPYTRINVMLQPLDWLQLGFRYTNVSNHLYGNTALSGSQKYKDKNADVRVRLFQETAYTPDLAVGIRDVGGTGLFSGEYFVASKRAGDFDWSLGLGWGYLGERGDFENPLSVFGDRFNTRKTADVDNGGTLHPSSWFRGRTALFGGMQYQTPWDPLILKLEYEGNNYAHEPLDSVLKQRTPFNFGAVYQVNHNFDLTLGYERGNTIMLSASLHGLLKNYSMVKLDAPPTPAPIQREVADTADDVVHTPFVPIPAFTAAPTQMPALQAPLPTENAGAATKTVDWSVLIPVLEKQTRWKVHRVYQSDDELVIEFDDIDAFYIQDQLNRAAAVLNISAPANITRFRIVPRRYGVPITDYQIQRTQWIATHAQAPMPDAQPAINIAPPLSAAQQKVGSLYEHPTPSYDYWLGPGYSQTLGGPNGFILYELSAQAQGEYRFTPGLWLAGDLKLRLLDNYNNYTYDAPSNLPRVRTNLREYQTSSRLQMSYLQLTKLGRLSDNQFYSMYGGYLESMFAGAGGEWLYRNPDSPLAVGIDLNEVQQRGFHQNFGLRDYTTFTGHITAYWNTGWHDVQVNLSAGQYLAKDRGATLDISRTFRNGIVMGAFMTRTNVSYAQFGEGSFDKGIYLKIPFDALFTYSTKSIANVVWTPLTRDGGAKLNRQYPLYDMTNFDDQRSLWYQLPETGAKP